MKKITLKTCCFLLMLVSCPLVQALESTLEIRGAALYQSSSHFRKIFHDFSPSVELEGSISCNPCYALWANLSWSYSRGRATGHTCDSRFGNCQEHPRTNINILNLSLGIKFPYQFSDCLIGYIGIGPVFGNVWLRDHRDRGHSDSSRSRRSKFAFGGIVKLGGNYYMTQCTFLDFFVDYIYQPVHFGRHNNGHKHTNVGGVKFGAGLGFNF